MVYSEVVKNGWILPKKALYTIKHVNGVVVDSLFGRFGQTTLTTRQAAFIVKCSAVFWDTNYSKAVGGCK